MEQQENGWQTNYPFRIITYVRGLFRQRKTVVSQEVCRGQELDVFSFLATNSTSVFSVKYEFSFCIEE